MSTINNLYISKDVHIKKNLIVGDSGSVVALYADHLDLKGNSICLNSGGTGIDSSYVTTISTSNIVPVSSIDSTGFDYVVNPINSLWIDAVIPITNCHIIGLSLDGKYQTTIEATKTVLYVSNNYGSTWDTKVINTTGLNGDISILNDGSIQMAVGIGNIYLSFDYGVTWIEKQLENVLISYGDWQRGRMSVDGSKMVVCGRSRCPMYSHDSGATWTNATDVNGHFANGDFISLKLDALCITGDGMIQLAGDARNSNSSTGLHRSTDGGVNWDVVPNTNHKWGSIAITLDGGIAVAAVGTNAGGVYKSLDAGLTWVSITPAAAAAVSLNFRTIDMSGDGKFIVAGVYNSSLWLSNDYGVTWEESTSAGSEKWNRTRVIADGSLSMCCASNIDIKKLETKLYVGELVYLSDPSFVKNNGIFQVGTESTGSRVTIETNPDDITSFVRTMLEPSSGVGISATVSTVSILKANTDGSWVTATGSNIVDIKRNTIQLTPHKKITHLDGVNGVTTDHYITNYIGEQSNIYIIKGVYNMNIHLPSKPRSGTKITFIRSSSGGVVGVYTSGVSTYDNVLNFGSINMPNVADKLNVTYDEVNDAWWII
jgi:photosystem II stability/assembly factor-like uncharacterized protein